MREVRIVDSFFRVSAKVLHLVPKLTEQNLELFLHLEAAVIRSDCNQFRSFRSTPRRTSYKLDLSFIDYVLSQRRQTSIFTDSQDCAGLKSTHIILSDDALRRFITRDGTLRAAFRNCVYEARLRLGFFFDGFRRGFR